MYTCVLRATRVSTACILAQVQAAARELLEAMRRTGAIPADLADFLSSQVAAGSAESRSASAPSASRAAADMATQGSGQRGPWPAQTAASDATGLAAGDAAHAPSSSSVLCFVSAWSGLCVFDFRTAPAAAA